MMTSTPNKRPTLYHLEVCRPDGSVHLHPLYAEHVLIVGSSSACGLKLEGRTIAGMHCSMEALEAGLRIRDWSSDGGTFVDGRLINEELMVQPGSEIRIADYRMTLKSVASQYLRKTEVAQLVPPVVAVGELKSNVHIGAISGARVSAETGALKSNHSQSQKAESMKCGDTSLMSQPASSSDTSAAEWNRDFDPWDSIEDETSRNGAASSDYARDSFSDNTADLLQIEVEFLRAELADRDLRLSELENLSTWEDAAPSESETLDRQEAEQLVSRLEQLLLELEERDTQISTLTGLLRASEEAIEAADEERQQMETWIGEVERRVSVHQDEWHAERERLERSMEELTQQRDRAEQRFSTGDGASASGGARDELLQQIRDEYTLLKTKFIEGEQEREQLRGELAASRETDSAQQLAAAVDAALREERLALAQEKATIARLKSELARQQEDLKSTSMRGDAQADSADLRIRAFREHLREIHETEPRQVRVPTFSERMAKLVRKLEGRPLDTD